MSRIRLLRNGIHSGKTVVYWMIRDKRAHDNYALLTAQKLAIKHNSSLLVCFQYIGSFPHGNLRQYEFLFRGLKETSKLLNQHNIDFYLLQGPATKVLPKFLEQKSAGSLVVDYSPLKVYKKRIKKVLEKIHIPVCQVDTHNIVPVWISSNKKEFAAHTIRKKINNKLDDYLSDIPKLLIHPIKPENSFNKTSWDSINKRLKINKNIKSVDWIKPGEKEALGKLENLMDTLKDYHSKRNNPTINGLSNLSPYFHFGHISPQRVAYEIYKSPLQDEDKNAFLEEMIIRRELADNFCEYEKNYDFFEGFHPWAQKTLNEHRNDERQYIYTPQQLISWTS